MKKTCLVIIGLLMMIVGGCNETFHEESTTLNNVSNEDGSNMNDDLKENSSEMNNEFNDGSSTLNEDDIDSIENQKIDKELLLEDFDQMIQIINDRHSFVFIEQEAYNKVANEYRDKINDSMTLGEFYRLAKACVTELGCGHSRLIASDAMRAYRRESGSFIPVRIQVLGDEAWLTEVYADTLKAQLVDPYDMDQEGSLKVLSINGMDIEDIIKDTYQMMSADGGNESTKALLLNEWFSEFFYEAYGESNLYSIELSIEGKSKVFEVAGISEQGLADARGDEGYPSFGTEIHEEYALLVIPTFNYYEEAQLVAFSRSLDEFFAEYEQDMSKPLIIDMRENWGGDPRASAYLFSHLTDEPFVYFDTEGGGRYYENLIRETEGKRQSKLSEVYLIVDGACFSTAGHFAALFKFHEIGTIIGQQTGGGFACSDMSDTHVLNHTEIKIRLSEMLFQVQVTGMDIGKGVTPDVILQVTPDTIYKDIVEMN